MLKRKRAAIAALALTALAPLGGCTNAQVAKWLEWHSQDPAAAEAFAEDPAVQQSLAERENRPAQAASNSGGGGSVWDRLAQCESGGNWSINTGNGYYGGLQFLPSTWRANGGSGMPHQASREEQIRVAENLRANSGFAPWPACSPQTRSAVRLRLLAIGALPMLMLQECAPQCAPEPSAPIAAPAGADGTGTPGDCASYHDDMEAAGLPVDTFSNIGWRETGCDPWAWVWSTPTTPAAPSSVSTSKGPWPPTGRTPAGPPSTTSAATCR